MAKLKKDYLEGTVSLQDGDKTIKVINYDDLDPAIQRKLGIYGLSVKLQRATAGVSEEHKKDRIISVMRSLELGVWSVAPNPQKVAIEKTIATLKDLLPSLEEEGKETVKKKILELQKQL